MLKLILQQKIGVDAAKIISDEPYYSTNFIRELNLFGFDDNISTLTYRALLKAIWTNRSFKYLPIHFTSRKPKCFSDSGFNFSTVLEKILLRNKLDLETLTIKPS